MWKILIVLLVFLTCSCSTLNRVMDGAEGMRDAIDGVTKKWTLTEVKNTPAKFNSITGDMWVLGADGWVKIGDVTGHTAGEAYISRQK